MSCQLHKNQKIYKQFQLATSSINWVFIQNFVQTQCQTKNKGNPENNFFKFLQDFKRKTKKSFDRNERAKL
jgi:hypothetical protein